MAAKFDTSIAGSMVFNLCFRWNRHARVLLCDSESKYPTPPTILPGHFAMILRRKSEGRMGAQSSMRAVWLLGLPILYTTSVVSRRIADKRNPNAASRYYSRHVQLNPGFSHTLTVRTMRTAAAMLFACGMKGCRLNAPAWLTPRGAVDILMVYYVWIRRVIRALNTGAH